jgi:hypothetical protein
METIQISGYAPYLFANLLTVVFAAGLIAIYRYDKEGGDPTSGKSLLLRLLIVIPLLFLLVDAYLS